MRFDDSNEDRGDDFEWSMRGRFGRNTGGDRRYGSRESDPKQRKEPSSRYGAHSAQNGSNVHSDPDRNRIEQRGMNALDRERFYSTQDASNYSTDKYSSQRFRGARHPERVQETGSDPGDRYARDREEADRFRAQDAERGRHSSTPTYSDRLRKAYSNHGAQRGRMPGHDADAHRVAGAHSTQPDTEASGQRESWSVRDSHKNAEVPKQQREGWSVTDAHASETPRSRQEGWSVADARKAQETPNRREGWSVTDSHKAEDTPKRQREGWSVTDSERQHEETSDDFMDGISFDDAAPGRDGSRPARNIPLDADWMNGEEMTFDHNVRSRHDRGDATASHQGFDPFAPSADDGDFFFDDGTGEFASVSQDDARDYEDFGDDVYTEYYDDDPENPAFTSKDSPYNAGRGRGMRSGSMDEAAIYGSNNYVGRRSGGKKNHKVRNIVLICVLAVVLVIGCCGVALAFSVKDARSEANNLMSSSKTLMNQLKNGDKAAALQTESKLEESASKLNNNVSGPLWAIATIIPVYGSDVAQVRTIAKTTDTLCSQVLGPIVEALPDNGLKDVVVDGGVNAQAIEAVLVPIGAQKDTITACAEEIESMGEVHLKQLESPIQTLKSAMGMLGTAAEYSTELQKFLPGMLGVNESANYLLIAANNAEVRSTGGMGGSFGLMSINNGKIELSDFMGISSAQYGESTVAVNMLTNEEVEIFGKRAGGDLRDCTYIPSFPRVAELEKALWEENGHTPVRGVIMLDPVFLQKLLALTNGVTTSDGTVVNGTNAAQVLMNDVYVKYGNNNTMQDAFFAEVATLAFDKIMGNLGEIEIPEFMETVSSAFENRRLYIWMADTEEESFIMDLGYSGMTSTSLENPVAGIYYATTLGSKICWYLDSDVSMGSGKKNPDGSISYPVTLTLSNTLSNEAAADMPTYIVADSAIKRSASDMNLDVYLYAPAGGSISNISTDGFFFDSSQYNSPWYTTAGSDPMTRASYNGQEVWYGITSITGNASTTITYTVTTSPEATSPLEIDMTPLANENFE